MMSSSVQKNSDDKYDHLLAVKDFERAAQKFLPHCVFEFLRGGTEDEITLNANRNAYDSLAFRPRGLCDVSERSQTVDIWGTQYSSPIGIAPTGVAGMFRHDCDAMLAAESARANIPFIISGASNVPLERLASLNPDSWYQGYFPGDREQISKITQRLSAARIKTIVVTIDTCVGSNRENNMRNHFTIPFKLSPRVILDGMVHPAWSLQVFARTLIKSGVPRFVNMYAENGPRITESTPGGFRQGRDKLSWEILKWLRSEWQGRLVVKGVMHPADAKLAASLGVDALIVSNHGGRQLDTAMSSLQALPDVLSQVPSATPVFLDGGIRRGTDVLKAVALGAKLVFMGRPTLYGAAVGANHGIRRVISILTGEIDRNLALLGCRNLSEVTPDLLQYFAVPKINPGDQA